MPDNNQQSPWEPKSERVVQLLAACIRTGTRIRFARELPRSDSIDLARIHDLSSAMKSISAKMEVHQNLPSDQRRFDLAVNEAKLISQADIGTEKVVAIREASIAALESSNAISSQRRLVVVSLRLAQEEARSWARAYSRFMTDIESLHKSASGRLQGLRLATSVRVEAQSELEQIIVDAIGRAGEIDSGLL